MDRRASRPIKVLDAPRQAELSSFPMAEPNSAKGKPPAQKGDPRRREFPRWKKVVLTCFAFLLLVGVALRVYGYFKDDERQGFR